MIIPVVLIVLIVLLWSQLTIEGFTPIWKTETGIDYGGNDINTLSNISLKDCKQKCIGDTTCKGISTDFNGDGPGTCWMKSDLTTGTTNASRWVYKIKRS